ncbi:MAG: HAD-IA family hydrolase [Candidatus Stygibacter australis]|nr:HAD-IA family hydrolase [Candidatus Stygibacter australis]MDP8322079.1 HAD-IA family hydrolase [Candidatus Stygibacter australis]
MIEAVIFDMDGVIINSERDHYLANQKLYKYLGISLDAVEYDRFVGLSSKIMWTEVREEFQLKQSVDELMGLAEKAIMEHFSNIELTATVGFMDLLDYINERSMKIAVASSSPLAMVNLVVDKLGIKDYFDLLVSGDQVEQGKPYPDIFIHTAALLQSQPGNCMVIEDSHNGALAAKRANMNCIGYQNPSSGNQDLSICDLVVNSFLGQDLENLLDYLW